MLHIQYVLPDCKGVKGMPLKYQEKNNVIKGNVDYIITLCCSQIHPFLAGIQRRIEKLLTSKHINL